MFHPKRIWSTQPWKVVMYMAIFFFVLYPLRHTTVYRDLASSTTSIAADTIAHAAAAVASHSEHERPLVLYAYADSGTSRQNLEFFVEKGLHGRADFVFIFNGETDATEIVPSFHPNIEVVQRNNTCYDLGAFGEVLRQGDRWRYYKRFVLLNASVRGPFFPNYMKPCWTDAFLGRLNDHIKLVGTNINCAPYPHLQSMVLATDDVGMALLLDPALATSLKQSTGRYGGRYDPVGLSACYADRDKAVHAEIGLTGLIQSKGYGVDSMLTSFSVEDGETLMSYCDPRGFKRRANPLLEGRYFGTNTHPYETIFMKTNRNVATSTIKAMTDLHQGRSWTSWEVCGPP